MAVPPARTMRLRRARSLVGGRALTFGLGIVASTLAAAQAVGGSGIGLSSRAFLTLDSSLTYLDTRRPNGSNTSDLVVDVRPGLRITSRTGRVQGSLFYSLGLVQHLGNNRDSSLQHLLSLSGTAEAIERWLYVDAAASISRQSLSAFGRQSVVPGLSDDGNTTEVGTISLSPRVAGQVAGIASYSARVTATATETRKSDAGDSYSVASTFSLGSLSESRLSWGLQFQDLRSDFKLGRSTQTDRVTASLSYVPDVDWLLTVRAGQESTDVLSTERKRYDNYGASARWRPGPRTLVQFDTDKRYFGQSHSLTLEHRFPLTSLRFTSVRDVSSTGDPNAVGQPLTLFQMFYALFASIQPDPVLREQFVIDYLRSIGQDPGARVGAGVVNSGVSLLERHDLSWSYAGRRLTLTLQAFATRSQLLDNVSAANEEIAQRGLVASASHRLTQTATASLIGSLLRTAATPTRGGTELQSISLNWTERLSLRTGVGLTARYGRFSSPTDPYSEAAISASLNHRF